MTRSASSQPGDFTPGTATGVSPVPPTLSMSRPEREPRTLRALRYFSGNPQRVKSGYFSMKRQVWRVGLTTTTATGLPHM
jgi:hypothetical protein